MESQPTVVTVVTPTSSEPQSAQQANGDGQNSELIRLAQEAAQATESNRQMQERLNQVEAGRETDRTRIESLEAQNRELIQALEEEEEEPDVTVITPPPPAPVEEEIPEEPKKEKGLFEKFLFG